MTYTPAVDSDPTATSIEPLGAWVVVPDGRIGQVWAQHRTRGRWWVAFGTTGDHFALTDLRPAEGDVQVFHHDEQELPL